VQVGSPTKPITVVVNGVASEAVPDDGTAVPEAQETLTLTDAPSSGRKSLFTVKEALLWTLMIVQEALPPIVISTAAQPAWTSV
jgi:hypothetical protein